MVAGMREVEVDDERARAIEKEEELEAVRLFKAFDTAEMVHTRGPVVFLEDEEVGFEEGMEKYNLQDFIDDDDEDEEMEM